MKLLVVTPYPPNRDGIAAYAAQYVRSLRAGGDEVRVLSPGPSAAHEHLDTVGPRGGLALAKRVRAYDRVVVQFHPDFFYRIGASTSERAATSAALTVAFRLAHSVEVVVHEIDYRHGSRRRLDGLVTRRMWQTVDSIVVHTEQEKARMAAAFGVDPERIRVAAHGEYFVPNSYHSRESARESLGIPLDRTVFLSIGFVQPHKGFDRALRAFASLGPRVTADAALHVVGSLRLDEPDFVRHAEELQEMADADPNAHVHLGYLSDELFDRWILASDVVVLPYRAIWSSGVLERARLFDRPVIATAVGGLVEQVAGLSEVTLVDDDAALRAALAAHLSGRDPALPRIEQSWDIDLAGDIRAQAQRQVQQRAGLFRGPLVTASGVALPAAGRDGAASAPLRRLPGAHLAQATSARPAARLVKSVVSRLTAWQLAPVVESVNQLQQATIRSIDRAVETPGERPSR